MFISRAYLRTISDEKRRNLVLANVNLGSHPETGDYLFIPDKDRHAGTYVIGVQGVGKSGELENLIAYDCAVGNSIIVIDPHGDSIMHCLAALPQDRMEHTYMLDMEDEAYPFGVN